MGIVTVDRYIQDALLSVHFVFTPTQFDTYNYKKINTLSYTKRLTLP
jgi:hypothetical protein